jgi:hypothetical protein
MTMPDIEGLQRRVANIIIRDVLQEEPDDLVEGYLDEIMLAAHRIIQLPAYRFVAEGYANNIAAELTRLHAENAALRAAGQAVVNEWGEPWQPIDDLAFEEALDALRAALKEGGGE